jgi:hypothetical protein
VGSIPTGNAGPRWQSGAVFWASTVANAGHLFHHLSGDILQRHNWSFVYTTSKLGEAATEKVKHHKSRLAFWQGAKDKVMAEVRDRGIEVSESEAGGNYTKMGRAPQVMVRNDLQTRLTECHVKIQEHAEKVTEYEGWVQVLGSQDTRLSLNADDYLYFFGK